MVSADANEDAADQTVAGAEESQQVADTKPEESVTTTAHQPTISSEPLAPPPPTMDLETDFPPGGTARQ